MRELGTTKRPWSRPESPQYYPTCLPMLACEAKSHPGDIVRQAQSLTDLLTHRSSPGIDCDLSSEEVAALRELMRACHEVLVPAAVDRARKRRITVQEARAELTEVQLRPTATSIFSSQELVNLIAGYLCKRVGGDRRAMSHDAASARAVCRTTAYTFGRAIESVRFDMGSYGRFSLENLQVLLDSLPCVSELRVFERGNNDKTRHLLHIIKTALPFGRFKHLAFSNTYFSAANLKTLLSQCRSPGTLANLETLALRMASIGSGAALALAHAWEAEPGVEPFLPNLKSLVLEWNDKLSDDGLLALLKGWQTGLAPCLQFLDLRCCRLGPRSIIRLIDAMRAGMFPALRKLWLGHHYANWEPSGVYNVLDQTCLLDLLAAFEEGACRRMESLDLQKVDLSEAVVEGLVQACKRNSLPNLQMLALSKSKIEGGEEAIAKLSSTLGGKVCFDVSVRGGDMRSW